MLLPVKKMAVLLLVLCPMGVFAQDIENAQFPDAMVKPNAGAERAAQARQSVAQRHQVNNSPSQGVRSAERKSFYAESVKLRGKLAARRAEVADDINSQKKAD